MKKIYIAPSVMIFKCQGQQHILADSFAKITGTSTPEGEHLDNVQGDEGDTWNSGGVKSYGIWDE